MSGDRVPALSLSPRDCRGVGCGSAAGEQKTLTWARAWGLALGLQQSQKLPLTVRSVSRWGRSFLSPARLPAGLPLPLYPKSPDLATSLLCSMC